MKREFKSPCIIKDTTNTVLIMNDGFGYHLHGDFHGEISDNQYYIDEDCTNITHEYLQNTYGKVVSPEHAEFIIELGKNAGFSVWGMSEINGVFSFLFRDDELCLFETKLKKLESTNLKHSNCKKITIPLPPKADSKKWTPDFYDLGELPRHFDCVCNKCGGKCCTGQCDKQELSEWPCVGSVVTWGNKSVKGEVKALSDGLAWIKNEYGNYCSEYVSSLQKPKTPEEELRDDILDCDNFAITESKANQLANWLTNKGYEINKKPQ